MPGVYIIFIGTMGFAATQLIVGILGIVVLFQRQRQQRQGPQTALPAMLLGHRARVFPRLASSAGLGVVVGLAQGLEEVPVSLVSAFGQAHHVVDLLGRCPALVILHSVARSPAGASMLGIAVPADVGNGGEPAHGDDVGLSTLQNFGLGLALEVHVAPELGMPVDLLTRGDALLTSWTVPWVSGPEAAAAV
jgi:hypothetical protein